MLADWAARALSALAIHARGRFRGDLDFRPQVLHLHVPPLGEPNDAIERFANHSLNKLSAEAHDADDRFTCSHRHCPYRCTDEPVDVVGDWRNGRRARLVLPGSSSHPL
jgi:hypothetical protein